MAEFTTEPRDGHPRTTVKLLPGGWRVAQVVGLVVLTMSLAMISRRALAIDRPQDMEASNHS